MTNAETKDMLILVVLLLAVRHTSGMRGPEGMRE